MTNLAIWQAEVGHRFAGQYAVCRSLAVGLTEFLWPDGVWRTFAWCDCEPVTHHCFYKTLVGARFAAILRG